MESLDPFATPPNLYRSNRRESVDLFAETPRRRDSGESHSLSRALRSAMDPDFDYFDAQYDDNSILAAVSSAHSSQELLPEQNEPKIEKVERKREKKEKPRREMGMISSFFDKNTELSQEMMDDFLSPEEIERSRHHAHHSHRHHHRHRPKQVRMDEYLFKARRIDKGAREFGLKTTHEPKRGSKKKRSSIESLEVPDATFQDFVEIDKSIDNRFGPCTSTQIPGTSEDIDFSLAFSPSPIRKTSRNSKLTQFMTRKPEKSIDQPIHNLKLSKNTEKVGIIAPNAVKTQQNKQFPDFSRNPTKIDNSVTFNDPSIYQSDHRLLDTTVTFSSQKTPEKSFYLETVPMSTPSPRGKAMKQRKLNFSPLPVKKPIEIEKRKQNSFQQISENSDDLAPIQQVKRRKVSKKEPTFDIPSPINISDDENDGKNSNFAPKRKTLIAEEAERKAFGRHVSERERMMKELIVDKQFLEDRENGGVERRRAELQDGQVIRNKEIRKNVMHGTSCKCCRGYYDKLGMEESEKKEYINKVSRHRYVHQALPDTPEHYWDLTLGPRDDELEAHTEKSTDREWNWQEKTEHKGIRTWEKD